jgi:tetratricopeptide (TPR) repeat protein
MTDYFHLLGLPRTASDSEIRKAYWRLAKQTHPDANPENADAATSMRALNDAKAILFDPVKREQHRVMLGLSDELTAERLEEFRRRNVVLPADHLVRKGTHRTGTTMRRTFGWTKRDKRNYAFTLVVLACLTFAGFAATQYWEPHPSPTDPVQQIIDRHRDNPLPFDVPVVDTMQVPDDSLEKLERMADVFYTLGEFKSAAKYWEKCLEKDPGNEVIIRDLSMAYFKRGKYATSLKILSEQMHGDSNLVVAYYNLGVLFTHEEKPFDARNAFEAAHKVAERMQQAGQNGEPYLKLTADRLALMN